MMTKERIACWIRRYRIYLERGNPIPAESSATTTCKHCGREYRGNFCPRCGQSHTIGNYRDKKMHKTFREAYPILSKVFYHTIIELITRPGYMIRDYLRGHQVIYLGPITTLLVALSCVTLCTHIYDKYQPPKTPQKEAIQAKPDSKGKAEKVIYKKWGLIITDREVDTAPEKKKLQTQPDSKGRTEKEIYNKWGITVTSKDDGRIYNEVVASIWRVLREKLEDETNILLFAIFPIYGLAARRAFRKCNFGKQPLTAGAHYQTLVYLYAIFTLFPQSTPLMTFYLVWTYRGIYGMKWLKAIKYVALTACWTALYLAALLVALILVGLVVAYIIYFIFYPDELTK